MSFVKIFEVGPRDGLQNEKFQVPLTVKIVWIRELLEAGIKDLEVGSFVRLDRVPQMADTEAIYNKINTGNLSLGGARFWSLVPNEIGLARAIHARAKNIAVFTAATESFALKNIGVSIKKSLQDAEKIVSIAKQQGMRVRGYVSTAFGCPFEGPVSPARALRVIEKLADIGVEQVSIGDTIGVATPKQITQLMTPALALIGEKKVAGHFHDTRGTALANSLRALDIGVRTLDASAGGLGGCPFAPGASGNLATEDLVYMLHGMGIRTGIDLEKLSCASLKFLKRMGREPSSKYLVLAVACPL